ncbi:MAG: hypothetical protein KAR64_05200 [Thermoplasmatales archaeon]|nr:hypothetical protein [Thermoplasmatales archaeon]
MSPKNANRNLWNIILVVLAAIIIVAAYILASNPADEPKILSPEDIMNNYEEYLSKSIVVEGYYYYESGPAGEGSIISSIIQEGQSSTNYQRLPVNHSTINTTGLLIDKVKYKFTGLLKSDESIPGDAFILIAEKIEPV